MLEGTGRLVPTDHGDALVELVGLLAGCSAGPGRLALVSGGLACGKTELLQRFQRHAAASGALLLTATGSPAEQPLQAGVIDQLFHGAGLPPEIADRVSHLITPIAATVNDSGADVRGIHHSYVRPVHELCQILLELSRERPVVLCVDDVQFADSSSLQFILYLRRRMRAGRVVVVLAEWQQPQPTLPLFHAELTRRPHHRIRLAPLSVCGIAELLRDRVPDPEALAPAWHAVSGGNPMLVRALAEDRDAGHETGPDQVGPAFKRAVLECLHRWEAGLLEVARAIAVLGEERTPVLLGRLAGTTPEAVEQAVDVLTAAGLLLDGRFRHPGVGAAILDSTPGTERVRLRARAAELLYQRGAAAAVVADHLVAADRIASGWPVAVLRIAAEQALMGDDVAAAVRYLEPALPVVEPDERLGITSVLVRALWRVNPAAAVVHMDPLHEAMWAGELRGRDAMTVVHHALWIGDEATAVRALAVLDQNPGMLDAQSAAELRIVCQWFHGLDQATAVAADVVADADPWVAAAQAIGTFWTAEFHPDAIASAEHILRSCRLGDMSLEVVLTALLILVHSGHPDRAERWCDRLTAEAVRGGAVTWQAILEVVRADIDLRRGEVVVAAARAETALALLPHQGWGLSIGYPLAVLMEANTALGRHRVIADVMRLRVPDAMFATAAGLRYLHARGNGNLAVGRVLAAISDFQNCGTRMREWHVDLPVLAPWRCGLAQANLTLGRTEAARELISEQMLLPAGDRRTRGAALRVLAAAGEPAERPALLREAVRHLRRAGDRVELARALSDLGEALDTAGEHAEARELSRIAVAETKASFSGALPIPVDWGDGDAGDGRSVLSDSELRVAELAAKGHTNREISGILYITVSTVEQHLTRVYRKLGMRSRADLPHRLSPRTGAAPRAFEARG
ncbi:LuxR C-terminal-related transcriptional regulator [Lentzea jiangxiensis]|uniref:LuxR C-terminal-related transcriptional regulator n=1 Tax=Lentzea jiangxiensis TaxID=641025 RepID=UPI000B7D8BF4|nr:LuxR family transcriptional regulator [Lentzea jiangxiensis]